MKPGQTFADLLRLAAHLRGDLENKKAILLYAYNGTGKTRLSMTFKDMGKQAEARDTLYFNAFTEDLFHWNNDLVGDEDRRLLLNRDSRFFRGCSIWRWTTVSAHCCGVTRILTSVSIQRAQSGRYAFRA